MSGLKRLELTPSISSTFLSFFAIVFTALSFLSSNIRVPAASSTIPSISAGFMFKTFVIFPCMMRKLGLLMLS